MEEGEERGAERGSRIKSPTNGAVPPAADTSRVYPPNYFYLSVQLVRIQGQWNHYRLDTPVSRRFLFAYPLLSATTATIVAAAAASAAVVYLVNATNNICFYFCAGPSPALYFLKATRLWRTAGWIIERKPRRGRGEAREWNEPVILDKLLSKGEKTPSACELLCSS